MLRGMNSNFLCGGQRRTIDISRKSSASQYGRHPVGQLPRPMLSAPRSAILRMGISNGLREEFNEARPRDVHTARVEREKGLFDRFATR